MARTLCVLLLVLLVSVLMAEAYTPGKNVYTRVSRTITSHYSPVAHAHTGGYRNGHRKYRASNQSYQPRRAVRRKTVVRRRIYVPKQVSRKVYAPIRRRHQRRYNPHGRRHRYNDYGVHNHRYNGYGSRRRIHSNIYNNRRGRGRQHKTINPFSRVQRLSDPYKGVRYGDIGEDDHGY